MKRELDHCARRVRDDIENKRKAVDYTPVMAAYRDTILGKDAGELADVISHACDINSNSLQKEIIEALILGCCPAEDIDDQLKVPKQVQDAYAELFFDTSVFRSQLDVIDYMTNYNDVLGKDLKTKSVNVGYEYVLFKYGKLRGNADVQRKLIEYMFMSSACKAVAMNYATMDSDTCKHAIKHAELMLKTYSELMKTGGDEGNNGYELSRVIPMRVADDIEEQLTEINAAEIV